MIAVDTSSLIAFLGGEVSSDVSAVKQMLASERLALPPVVLMEALSDPGVTPIVKDFLTALPSLPILSGYWINAAKMRRIILGLKLKARLGDTLVAQSCVDYAVPLITRDKDFRHYAKHCGLKLYDAGK